MNAGTRTALATGYLLLCLIFGGASSAGLIANFGLQLLGALLIAAVLLSERRQDVVSGRKGLWLLTLGWFLLIGLQLVPISPGIWSSLPGRDVVEQGFASLGMPLPWLGLSLTPDGTIRALVSSLPVLAILALVPPASIRHRQLFLPLVIIFALVALVVGLTQRAMGPSSSLYFYAVTNWGHTVGFFANRNHQATLLLMTLPFVAALASPLLQGGRVREESVPKVIIIAILFAVVAGGVLMTGSRAGIALMPLVFGFCILMIRKDMTGNVPRSWVAVAALLVAGAIAVVGASGIVTRDALAQANVEQSTREAIWGETLRLAADLQPVGGGLGSFVPLYRMNEDPYDRPDEFTNHAHNDYLEWLLETGVPGLLLLAAFLLWYFHAIRRNWSSTESALGRAGSIGIGVVLLHSLVDYPIRTAAIAALCALCVALMTQAPRPSSQEAGEASAPRRGRRRRRR